MNSLANLQHFIETAVTKPGYAESFENICRIATLIRKVPNISDLDTLAMHFARENRIAGQYFLRASRSILALREDVTHDKAKLVTAIAIDSSIPAMQTGLVMKDTLTAAINRYCPKGLTAKLMGRPCALEELVTLEALGNMVSGKQIFSFADKNTGIMVWPILWEGTVADIEQFNKQLHAEGGALFNIMAVKQECETFGKAASMAFKLLPFASWENIFSIVRTLKLRKNMLSHLQDMHEGARLEVRDDTVWLKSNQKTEELQKFPEESEEDIHKMVDTIRHHTKMLQAA